MKQEAQLRTDFLTELEKDKRFIALRHEFGAGAQPGNPDLSITGGRCTTWLEFKHATPQFDDNGRQLLTMMRLAAAGHARYVIWWESATGLGKRTMIVHPREVRDRKGWLLNPEEVTNGHDHRWLVQWLLSKHFPR